MTERNVEYDHKSSVSFVIGLQTICGLMAGFAFTGILVILTRLGDPTALLSPIVLVSLNFAMDFFIMALFELHLLNILTSLESQKAIVPINPSRWRIINRYIFLGSFLLLASIPVLFLFKNLILLFVLSISWAVLSYILFYSYRWKPVYQKLMAAAVVS
jgi:hypothetical protein